MIKKGKFAILRRFLARPKGACAPNTLQEFRADLEEFQVFCRARGRRTLPATPNAVANFHRRPVRQKDPGQYRQANAGLALGHPPTFGSARTHYVINHADQRPADVATAWAGLPAGLSDPPRCATTVAGWQRPFPIRTSRLITAADRL